MTTTNTTNTVGEPSTPRPSTQQALELILLRQWASYIKTPIWLTSTDGYLLYFNEPAEKIIGIRFGEAGPLPVNELIARFEITDEYGAGIDIDMLPLAVALGERKPSHARIRVRSIGGEYVRISVTAFPIEGQGGRFLGAVAMFWEDDQA
jgi:PAS domain-containing protein